MAGVHWLDLIAQRVSSWANGLIVEIRGVAFEADDADQSAFCDLTEDYAGVAIHRRRRRDIASQPDFAECAIRAGDADCVGIDFLAYCRG